VGELEVRRSTKKQIRREKGDGFWITDPYKCSVKFRNAVHLIMQVKMGFCVHGTVVEHLNPYCRLI